MKKKRINLSNDEIDRICMSTIYCCNNNCSLEQDESLCLGIDNVSLFDDYWLQEEIEVEE